MREIISNLFGSKVRPFIILRGILFGAIVIMGLARLRLVLLTLAMPNAYIEREILLGFLMAHAVVDGVNPYLPLITLTKLYISPLNYYTHPAPYPPFVSIIFIPMSILSAENFVNAWFILELVILALISTMLVVLWKGKPDWKWVPLIFILLLAWFPVMVDLLYGQFSIVMTCLLLAALLALIKNHKPSLEYLLDYH